MMIAEHFQQFQSPNFKPIIHLRSCLITESLLVIIAWHTGTIDGDSNLPILSCMGVMLLMMDQILSNFFIHSWYFVPSGRVHINVAILLVTIPLNICFYMCLKSIYSFVLFLHAVLNDFLTFHHLKWIYYLQMFQMGWLNLQASLILL